MTVSALVYLGLKAVVVRCPQRDSGQRRRGSSPVSARAEFMMSPGGIAQGLMESKTPVFARGSLGSAEAVASHSSPRHPSKLSRRSLDVERIPRFRRPETIQKFAKYCIDIS